MAPETSEPPSAVDVYRARARLGGRVARTPLLPSARLARLCGAEQVLLKLETVQPSGAFKLRGATNALLTLDAAVRARGVVTASTGNHGRAVAWAARAEGVACTVCLSKLVPENKAEAVRELGAEVVRVGDDQDAAVTEALRLATEGGLGYIPPFDHPEVIAGQGTLGLELLEDAPELDTLLIPLSGGGLLAGVALAAKAVNPAMRIIGISPERGAAMIASLRAGQPVEIPEEPTLADSLGGGIGPDNRYSFAITQRLVDDVVQISEDEIAAAMRGLYRHERLITEGAAAAGALAARELARPDARIAGVLGTGLQARMQIEALKLVRPLEQVLVWGRRAETAQGYADEMTQRLGIPVEIRDTAEAVVREAEIVITTTPSREPIVQREWLHAGQHLTAMGSDAPYKNEIAPAALAYATRFVCDVASQSLALGELGPAMAAGVMTETAQHTELGTVVCGRAAGRTGDDDITLCDLTGTGAQDTAIAAHALALAQKANLGHIINA